MNVTMCQKVPELSAASRSVASLAASRGSFRPAGRQTVRCILATLVILVCASLSPAYDWLAPPDKVDLMVISAHPDDEGIFFGGVLPYYTQVLQKETILIDMNSGRHDSAPTIREDELRDAAWTYGLRYEPVFARFLSVTAVTADHKWTTDVNAAWDAWDGEPTDGVADNNANGIPDGREAGAYFLAMQIRTYQPEVIVTQDIDGEYGHATHKATALVTIDAYALAADPSVDIGGLAPWQASKLYIHQSEANGLGTEGYTFQSWLFHDYLEEPTIDQDGNPATPDLTPRQVADLGLDMHVSQGSPDVSTVYRTGENYDGHHSEWWGLYESTVGPDKPSEPFTIAGQEYDNWARGDFFTVQGSGTPPTNHTGVITIQNGDFNAGTWNSNAGTSPDGWISQPPLSGDGRGQLRAVCP